MTIKTHLKGFIDFIREQGVVGLAIGFLLGGAVAKLVTALVKDIINPLIGLLVNVAALSSAYFKIGTARILWGDLVSNLIDFLIVGLVVYLAIKLLKLNRLDKKSE